MKQRKKAGFTLVELMIFFIFMSLVIAAATPVITKRVKNIPRRFSHGQYICYRDGDGALHQISYNASKEITNEVVESCQFTPPKSIALFKVEVIGAGAGGYDDPYREKDTVTDASYTYSMGGSDGTGSGDIYGPLTDSQIYGAFNGSSVYLSAYTGNGGNGGDAIYRAFYPGDLYCRQNVNDICKEYENEEDNAKNTDSCTNMQAAFSEAMAALEASIPDAPHGLTSTVAWEGALNTACSALGGSKGVGASEKVTAPGESGGSGASMSYKYDLNLGSLGAPVSGILGWLQAFSGGFDAKSGSSGTSGNDKRGVGADTTMHGIDGSPAYGNAYIKTPDGIVCQVSKHATGGEGAKVSIGDQGIYIWDTISPGSDAEVTGDCDSGSSGNGGGGSGSGSGSGSSGTGLSFPAITVISEYDVLHHTYGFSGHAGQYKTYYVPSLGNAICHFTIPQGGAVMTPENQYDLDTNLDSVLTCKSGALEFRAKGGSYNAGTETKDYSLKRDSDTNYPDHTITSSDEDNEVYRVTQFTPESKIVKKYDLPEMGELGAGGIGNVIIDKCAYKRGSMTWSTSNGGGGGSTGDPAVYCVFSPEEGYKSAQPGNGGAILISW